MRADAVYVRETVHFTLPWKNAPSMCSMREVCQNIKRKDLCRIWERLRSLMHLPWRRMYFRIWWIIRRKRRNRQWKNICFRSGSSTMTKHWTTGSRSFGLLILMQRLFTGKEPSACWWKAGFGLPFSAADGNGVTGRKTPIWSMEERYWLRRCWSWWITVKSY